MTSVKPPMLSYTPQDPQGVCQLCEGQVEFKDAQTHCQAHVDKGEVNWYAKNRYVGIVGKSWGSGLWY